MEFKETFHKVIVNVPKEIQDFIHYEAHTNIEDMKRTLTITLPPFPPTKESIGETPIECDLCGKEVPMIEAPERGWLPGVYLDGNEDGELVICDTCQRLLSDNCDPDEQELSLSKIFNEIEYGQISFTYKFLELFQVAMDNKLEKIIAMHS